MAPGEDAGGLSVVGAEPQQLIGLRVAGALAAVLLLAWTFRRYSRRDASRLSLIVIGVVSLGIVVMALQPNLFNPLFNAFNLRTGGGRRIIGLLILANLAFFALLLRTMGVADRAAFSIRHLVEALAVQSFEWSQQALLPSGERIVVVMPAFNEAENVGGVVESMPERVEGLPVVPLVVDDASEDDTGEVARKAGALVARLPIRRGGGLALRVGYEVAVRLNARVVVSMDADGQHLPEEIVTLVRPILDGEADMVGGSRILGAFERESRVRHLGVHFFSTLVTVMTGSRVTDVSSGYRATRADVLKRLVLNQDQFWTSELLLEGMRHRLRITEVPITIRARAGGMSKKPKNVRYAWNFTKAIVKTWLR